MPYSHTTLTSALAQLTSLLSDPDERFWVSAEKLFHLQEALQFWNLLTSATRARKTITTSAGVAFYDLGSESGMQGALSRSTTDAQLLTLLKYHLLEPHTSQTGFSGQLDYATCLGAMQRALNRFKMESEMLLEELEQLTTSPPVSRVTIPDTFLNIRRVAVKDISGNYLQLIKESESAANAYAADWDLDSRPMPEVYSIVLAPQLQLQLIPPSNDITELHLLGIDASETLDPTLDFGAGVALDIQDDYWQFVKWLALHDVLLNDYARDSMRAQYCMQRYQEGVKLAQLSSSVLQASINGVNVELESLSDFDTRDPTWQSGVGVTGLRGEPTRVAICSNNMIALSPVPDGVYAVQLDVLANMTLPSIGGDYLQVARDHIEAIINYALHLASFKEGAAKMMETKPAFDAMMQMAAYQNSKLMANRDSFASLRQQTGKEKEQNPVSEKVTDG